LFSGQNDVLLADEDPPFDHILGQKGHFGCNPGWHLQLLQLHLDPLHRNITKAIQLLLDFW
jgi:hypothetical protein